MSIREGKFVRATRLEDLRSAGRTTAQLNGHAIVLFSEREQVYALDNRCPHMGFPLDRGTVKDGILTCHWHHARFDMESGGTFDQWADDVRCFPVEIRDGEVWVDVSQKEDLRQHYLERLQVGLERDLSLVIAKAVLVLAGEGGDPVGPFRAGLDFGTRFRRNGWGQGLTIHTCMLNILTTLQQADHPRALYHGLSAVSRDSSGSPPRFLIKPLPGRAADIPTLKRWFRRFVEVRDAEGAERCLVSAIRAGADDRQMADMLFSAATDHRYIDIGHVADFTNKAFEALEVAGWEFAEAVLTSLVRGYANADRMEESNAWRNPVDLVEILENVFNQIPQALENGHAARTNEPHWNDREELVQVLLGEDPAAIADGLVEALRAGASEVELASTASYAAALRIARFHTSNEFSDWDTALHTFTFANAIEQGMRRSPSVELLRGVFDAAMSIYLDRFLNIPAAPLAKKPDRQAEDPGGLLDELGDLLNRQHQVNHAGELVARYLYSQGDPDRLLAALGKLLLREDRDFHTIQTIEAAFRQFRLQPDPEAKVNVLAGAARYLAAHSPTMRSQGQTYEIAYRLNRGDRIYE